MTYYIYTLSNPKNNDVFYVGCTIHPKRREFQHHDLNRVSHFDRIVPSKWTPAKEAYIITHKIKPVFEILDQVETDNREEAIKIEEMWISLFRTWGFPMVNVKWNKYLKSATLIQ